MADSSVLLEVIVEGKNIKLVQRQVEELGAAINNSSAQKEMADKKDNAAQKQRNKNGKETYNNQRALINGSLSQGRANAKLASGITGGLVPAYAEIVSNIFAIQQAFSLLRRVQALQILEENLERTGAAAGRNLGATADGLREITEGALSARDALEATANATAQGFSTSQLEGLTRVAKGASSALGRDLTDSLDRLVRGTAKLEPEILDELGIIVRLDDATREYAASLGKAVGDLTQFERQQAFLNATLAQGEKKFGDTADSTQTNPYSQLAATFDDLAQSILEVANVAIVPIAKFFSQNSLALTGALLFFVQTIANRLTPTLKVLSESTRAAFAEIADLANAAGAQLKTGILESTNKITSSSAKLPKAFKEITPAIANGTASIEKLEEGLASLTRSENQRAKNLAKDGVKDRERKAKELQDIYLLRLEVQSLLEAKRALAGSELSLFNLESIQEADAAFDSSLNKIGEAEGPLAIIKATAGGVGEQFAIMGARLKTVGSKFITFAKDAFKGKFSLDALKLSSIAASISLRGLKNSLILTGQAFLRLIPFIGPALIIFDLLKSAFKFLFPESEVKKKTDSVVEGFSSLQESAISLQETLGNTEIPSYEKNVAQLKVAAGALDQLTSGLRKVEQSTNAGFEKGAKKVTKYRQRLAETKRTIKELGQEGTTYGRDQIKFAEHMLRQAEKDLKKKKENAKFTKKSALAVVDGFLEEIELNDELKDALGSRFDTLVEIRQATAESNDPEAVQKLITEYENLERATAAQNAAVQGLADGFSEAGKEALELTKKEDTQFSKQVSNFKVIANNLKTLATLNDGQEPADFLSDDQLVEATALQKTLEETLDLDFKGLGLGESIALAVKEMEALEDTTRTAISESKKLSAQAKAFAAVSKESASITGISIDLQNESIDAAILGKTAELKLVQASVKSREEEARAALKAAEDAKNKYDSEANVNAVLAARRALRDAELGTQRSISKVQSEIEALESTKVDKAERLFRQTNAQLALDKNVLAQQQKINANAEKRAGFAQAELEAAKALSRAQTGSDVNSQDQLALAQRQDKVLSDGAEERLRLQKEGIRIEYALLRAKTQFESARLSNSLLEQNIGANDPRRAEVDRQLASLTALQGIYNRAEKSANEIVDASEDNAKILRTSNIELLKEQVARDKIAAKLEALGLQQARVNMLIAEGTAFSEGEAVARAKIAQITQDLSNLQAQAGDNSLAIAQKQNELTSAQNELLTSQIEIVEKRSKVELEFQKKAISALKKRVDLEQQISAVERDINAEKGIQEFAFQRFAREKEEREARLAVAEAEKNIKLAMISAEFNLLKAKQAQLKAELSQDGLTSEENNLLTASQAVIDQQSALNGIIAGNIRKEFELLTKKEKLEELKSINAAAELASANVGAGGGIAAAFEGIRQLFEPPKEKEKSEIDKQLDKVFKDTEITAENKDEALIATVFKTGVSTQEAIKDGLKTVAETVNNAIATLTVTTLNAAVLNAQVVNKPGAATQNTAGSGTATTATANQQGTEMSSESIDDMINEVASSPTVNNASIDTTAAITDPGIDAMNTAITPPELPKVEEPANNMDKALQGARTTIGAFAAEMKQFGPEGEAMGAFLQGGVALVGSVSSTIEAFKAAETGAEKTKAVLGGIGSALGAIGQMQQAAAAGKVAAVDKEIAAERKRDGKSKESIAKIASLEKKKEAIQRKAFEQNKKIQLAQAVVNGLSAIQSGFATQPFFPLGIAMGALAIAMTAMQIKAIQSQQYNGGASSTTGASAPSSISIGQRKTTSDLAKTQSVSGELSYMRGDQGMGGPEKFQPAFMGAKYRAMGGSTTGYVVGEQGPELFVPETAGTIVPNDETNLGNGGSTAVTFNINTIDASGVEDLLVQQQGNIIGMVRSAANQYGESFLEQVEVSSLTQQAGGVTKY